MASRNQRPEDAACEMAREAEPEGRPGSVLYAVEDVPAPHLCFLFGLQQAIMCIGGSLSIPFIISGLICASDMPEVTSELLSITMFMCGVATLLQIIFGIRLGIVQGGSHTFVAPIVAMMAVDKWACPETGAVGVNGTAIDREEVWQSRMREIQGNLMVASLTQVFLGCTGLIGVLMRFIGPLTIAPTISLIGLSLTGVVIEFNKVHWGVAFLAMALTLMFTLYLGGVRVPFPGWTRIKGCHMIKYPLFQLFPVILSICFSWLFCYILTVTDTFTTNSTLPAYQARTDARLDVLERAPWFYWPYPFQFGIPSVSAAGYVGLLAATLSSIIESIGDYFACARISGAPPPPAHAVNRGIGIEGLSSIVSGLVGAGHGTTSYSGNIGAIGITKVASRAVFLTAGGILIVCGVVGKFGAVLSLIPDPVIGGTLTVLFGMVSAVGISTLKYVDLDSTRNLTILGTSLLLGLMVPQFINDPNNAAAIDTGSEELDQMIRVMLGTAMFVGGFVGCFLDNTVPGTPEERGILSWRQNLAAENSIYNKDSNMYDLPLVTKCFRRAGWCAYIPISPSFDKDVSLICQKCCCCKNSNTDNTGPEKYAYENSVDVEVPVVQQNGTKM
ncbi:solute carrier family 23 member 2-like isoform X1 [Mya arenaria]|uniref:solute carrier family 23 member 2-like isoform X1 n=1 Tax=Mya arenaria TaxID=6604 RepID=UPI0022E73192|nr:solute carrier family 23 member 2-like isoform X1 [Mya arenaria]XP_052770615.1 solute carrier family 23 member 2-like isoform X1 [Mya arenaria]XP_052770616.1 solute carrier family 23 member 2-like isoform X1 [Mya arenaria]XP_052770617.1 solute carrier family 23 member 2-like isoform X1 [Mya arenaria]XP_052770618.1 solute carrier family 23 member 2-like isoform X1 [Mya arenaria]XP_052770620.1 solute carrier family 23 member 2-like isoform X1 [Mya arenaria]XP_052770621.1 solute carrier famil